MRDVERRLEDLEDQLGGEDGDHIEIVVVIPIDADNDKRPPGFYWPDRPGCGAAELVFDPAAGDPEVPKKYRRYMSDHCVTLRIGPAIVPEPIDDQADEDMP
jgi:hypothetical protein